MDLAAKPCPRVEDHVIAYLEVPVCGYIYLLQLKTEPTLL